MKKITALLVACAMTASMMGGALTVQAADKTDIVIAIDAEVSTLHPSDFSTTVEHNVLSQLYDPLMYMNLDGAHDPEPRIAESYEISDDGLSYTFKLRQDATFHDGTPITSADVKFSLELYQASDYQGFQVTGLSSVETPDDYTVVCKLDSPYSPFLLGVLQVNIASKAYYESSPEDFVNSPIGSGPYKFVSKSKENVVLEAYEDYYRGAAAIKDVTFDVVPEQSTQIIGLMSDQIDFASIESSSIAQLATTDTVKIAEVANSGFTYVSMNTEAEPFNDAKVRQAVNYAINREDIVEMCYDGKAEVNSNICSKERFGYSEEQFQYTYDPEKAKELLAEAGIETPYNLGEMLIAEKYSNLAAVIKEDLAEVGLEMEIKPLEFNAYIDDLTSGNYTITALEMTLDGDTQSLEMAFVSDFIGTANNARYNDPAMDDLFSQTRTETDTEARAALFNEAFTKAQDEAIYAVLCNPLTLFAYDANLTCPEFAYEGMYYIYDFAW